jgi:hypothetical protein
MKLGSGIKKHRFILALHMDIEAVNRWAFGFLTGSDQGVSPFGFYRTKNRIIGISRFVRKIDASHGMDQHPARENMNINIRGHSVPTTGFDRFKLVAARIPIFRTAKASKMGIGLRM